MRLVSQIGFIFCFATDIHFRAPSRAVTTAKRNSLAGARSKGRFVCRVHRGTGRLADINGKLLRGTKSRAYRRVNIDGKQWMWHILVAFAATCATGFTPTAQWWASRTVDHKNGFNRVPRRVRHPGQARRALGPRARSL